MLLLIPVPRVQRVSSWLFSRCRLRSLGSNQQRRRHQPLTAWGRQLLWQRRRWLPGCQLVVVTGRTDAVVEVLACAARMIEPVAIITRLRLDAALSDPAASSNHRASSRDQQPVSRPWRTTWRGMATTCIVELASHSAVWKGLFCDGRGT